MADRIDADLRKWPTASNSIEVYHGVVVRPFGTGVPDLETDNVGMGKNSVFSTGLVLNSGLGAIDGNSVRAS